MSDNPYWPPLVNLAQKPLHDDGHPLPDGVEWACHIPEEVDDGEEVSVRFDWRCSNCVGAAKILIIGLGDTDQEWRHTNDSEPQIVKLSWLIERADFWASDVNQFDAIDDLVDEANS